MSAAEMTKRIAEASPRTKARLAGVFFLLYTLTGTYGYFVSGQIVVSGDAAAYPVQYLHSIEGARSDLSVIQPPLLPAAWYARELRRLYPELNLPAGGGAVTLQGLLDANASRRFVQAGHDLDRSITPAYRLDLRGLDADVVAGTTPPPRRCWVRRGRRDARCARSRRRRTVRSPSDNPPSA